MGSLHLPTMESVVCMEMRGHLLRFGTPLWRYFKLFYDCLEMLARFYRFGTHALGYYGYQIARNHYIFPFSFQMPKK